MNLLSELQHCPNKYTHNRTLVCVLVWEYEASEHRCKTNHRCSRLNVRCFKHPSPRLRLSLLRTAQRGLSVRSAEADRKSDQTKFSSPGVSESGAGCLEGCLHPAVSLSLLFLCRALSLSPPPALFLTAPLTHLGFILFLLFTVSISGTVSPPPFRYIFPPTFFF